MERGKDTPAPAGAAEQVWSAREVRWALDLEPSALDGRVVAGLVTVRGPRRPGPGRPRAFPFASVCALVVLEDMVSRYRMSHEGARPILAAICACSAAELECEGDPLCLVWDGEEAPALKRRREVIMAAAGGRLGDCYLCMNLSVIAAEVRQMLAQGARQGAPDAQTPTVEEDPPARGS
jgi:hypothetical protein